MNTSNNFFGLEINKCPWNTRTKSDFMKRRLNKLHSTQGRSLLQNWKKKNTDIFRFLTVISLSYNIGDSNMNWPSLVVWSTQHTDKR